MTHFTIRQQTFAAAPLEPGVYVVATPIGNLGDVTLRALDGRQAIEVYGHGRLRCTSDVR